jgi:hypothetical protein
MARRRAKPKRRTNRSRGVRLIPLAASYVSASAVTGMLFNQPLWGFLTTDWMGSGRGVGSTTSSYNPSATGQGQYNMTLAEIVKAMSGQTSWSDFTGNSTFGENVFQNFQNNWWRGGLQLIGGAAMPKVLNNIPGKPIQKVNKLLKQIGVGDVIKL